MTASSGWLEMPSPALAIARGAPPTFALRLRAGTDADGIAFVYAEEVRVGDREYGGVFALLSREGNFWASRLADAVFAQIDARRTQRSDDGPRVSRSGTSMRAVRPEDMATTRVETKRQSRAQ